MTWGVSARVIAVLVILGLATFPIYWMFVTALTPNAQLYSPNVTLLPDLSRLSVFAEVIQDGELVRWLVNSFIVAAGTTVLSIGLGVPLAYALSRYRFKGMLVLVLALLFTQMLPEALLVVPLFALFGQFDLLNTLQGLILANTAFALPVVALILKGAVDGVPRELDEAVRVDGGRPLTILGRIIVPLIAPAIAAAAVIAFFSAWNEFVFAVTFVFDKSIQPATVGLAGFIGEQNVSTQSIMAASLLFTLPAIIFYMFVQRFVVSGMTAGAVKG
ncbi:carbohydrate ABC transporter permease [Microbacterium sp. ET2]|uniref:carbohydrate ABC transporter permease n=1 Tax=Microbacterium albipurpureum TaxID=3050384 RepID=UPI00259CEA5E|nr:carbohydrate ABC transporter permease [Microbacterium sp. ET2 (Ac-2212)]WJL94951.1 carbohydrate ABC transporter permease [Microbacterium sp. ET2 (Ac-2212)]